MTDSKKLPIMLAASVIIVLAGLLVFRISAAPGPEAPAAAIEAPQGGGTE